MSYISIALNHFRSIQKCTREANVQATIDCATFCLELKGKGRYFTLFPQFNSLIEGRMIYTGEMIETTKGFIGWLPYKPVSWPEVSDKLSFKKVVSQNGMRTPRLISDTACPEIPYLVKHSIGSFGYGLDGPFKAGTPVRKSPTSPSASNSHGTSFLEEFIPGSILKVWFWGTEAFFSHLHHYPSIKGNDELSARELVQQRLSSFGQRFDGQGDQQSILSCLNFQNISMDTIIPKEEALWIDYRYGRQYANLAIATAPDNSLSALNSEARASIEGVGVLLGDLLERHFGAPILYAVDGVIDAHGDVWWLEANTNPMVPPDAYSLILATLFGIRGARPRVSL